MSEPIYKLKQPIIKKYGQEKFSLGCEIVAQWLCGYTGVLWRTEDIIELCNTSNLQKLSSEEEELLRKLFGLQTVEEIYNKPKESNCF